jgi:hypothetical protein
VFTLFLQALLTRKSQLDDHTTPLKRIAMQALSIAAAGMMGAQGRFESSAPHRRRPA